MLSVGGESGVLVDPAVGRTRGQYSAHLLPNLSLADALALPDIRVVPSGGGSGAAAITSTSEA